MTGPTDNRLLDDDRAGGTEPDRPMLALLLAYQRRAWRRGERAAVEAYFAQYPALAADAEAVLDLIYQEVLLREQAGESPRLEEYRRRFPHLAPQLELQFEVEGALGPALPARSGGGTTLRSGGRPRPALAPLPAVPGYEVLGELGRGGMGVVYKVRQPRLNRVAALKMILAGDHAGPEDAARFLGEAEAVARLHHPNIVQVFACGDHDGHPYFEMEYVPGGSLADRLDGTPWPPREAARLVETLARALDEVHRLGVVHRDLKPANVLLAADGTPKVADFGLAKWLDGESGLTRTDHVLGSPSYMAPEQAEGKAGAVGPAADVYSLGAVLYELLTGRPPFKAATALETLEQVKSAEPVAPRRLQPKLPRDLETVCLKCLRKEPSRRYDSAADLAEDLRRFGAGEPVRARPVGVMERGWRWCRREPALTALAAALMAASVVGCLGVATQWLRAEGHLGVVLHQRALLEADVRREVAARLALEKAHAREQEARRRAQQRFQLGMKAVDGYSALAREDELRTDPRLEGLRKRLLGTALGFYTELQKSLEADPTAQARYQLSDAYGQVASLHEEMGARREALAAHQRSLALRETLAAAEPANQRLQASLARSHVWTGRALREVGRLDEAARSVGRGLAIEEVLVRDHPTNTQYKGELAWSLHNLGLTRGQMGRADEAVRLLERSAAIREDLARVEPANPRRQSDLAQCQTELGSAYDDVGRPDESLRWIGRAAATLDELVRAHPEDDRSRASLARCLATLGAHLRRAGRPGAELPSERSVAIREALVRDHPTSVPHQTDLVWGYLFRATVRAGSGRRDEALSDIHKAEQLLERSAEVSPLTLYNLACAYAQCSAAGRRGEGALSPAERTERKAYGDRAMIKLSRAVTSDYRLLSALILRDLDLDPLRPRRDFQEMMMDLSFPADPFHP
jgi:tetratricopeptide (TPR) repeat protein/tRNA A-37 threonylcarbamoyl transferase component Bud32